MPLMSGGQLVLADTTPPIDNTWHHPSTGLGLSGLFSTYGTIYKRQKWVYTVVHKRALATRRLPLKVYRRREDGREEARDHPLALLLRRPNPRHSAAFLWEWTSSTFDIYGEALWLKVRGRDGMPAEVWPVHPSNIVVRQKGNHIWYVYGIGVASGADPEFVIPEADIVHFKSYHPDSTIRGLSTLEPLRQTLLNEDAARRASAAFWLNGARPSVLLTHPQTLSEPAQQRLAANWAAIHGGVDNFGKTAVLEEGMKPEVVQLSAEESQYIESRQLNREEVMAAYDVPPPVVHDLRRATFSNITEQMRSMYRDTMAPHLSGLEATLAFQLSAEFDGDVYCEFLMDEVLRGDFEQRVEAYQKALNSGWLTINEVRALENQPPVEGGDVPYVNSTMVPLQQGELTLEQRLKLAESMGLAAQRLGLATNYGVLSPDEARPVIGLSGAAPEPPAPPALPATSLDALWGRLGTYTSVDEIEPGVLCAGLNGHAATVRALLEQALEDGDTIVEFRARCRAALA